MDKQKIKLFIESELERFDLPEKESPEKVESFSLEEGSDFLEEDNNE